MPWHDDLHTHLRGALDDRIKIVDLEPQQDTVSALLVISMPIGP